MLPASPGIDDLMEKVQSGERLTYEDGLRLYAHPNLPELAALATVARRRARPEPVVTFAVEEGTALALGESLPTGDAPFTLSLSLSPSEPFEDRVSRILQAREALSGSPRIAAVLPLSYDAEKAMPGSAYDYLRAVAVARLLLDNAPRVQASIPTQGLKIAQMALEYGADDFGAIPHNLDEEGRAIYEPPLHEIERNIREAGFEPQARTALFEPCAAPRPAVPSLPISLNLG